MESPTHLSEGNIRRYGKGIRSSKKSLHMYSDYYDEKEDGPNLGSRSISLTALHPGQTTNGVLLEPRMAQLETLEAKMASIEVSLSTASRRKKNGPIYRTSKDIVKELEALRNALRDKENMIQSLKNQLCTSFSRLSSSYLRNNNGGQPLSEKERRAADERLQRLRQEMDNKRLAIKNLKMTLERLDITDNIDVRIQQAEIEYQLGREELNLLTLLEESRNLQACLDEADQNKGRGDSGTIYSCLEGPTCITLHATEVQYDPKSPTFGAGKKEGIQGLYVEWATEESGMIIGDRLIEVNGKLVLHKTKDDMLKLLAISPDPAQIVILRSHPTALQIPAVSVKEVQSLRDELSIVREHLQHKESVRDELLQEVDKQEKEKESLRSENLRLTHRISYLEEQVSELHKSLEQVKNTPNNLNAPGPGKKNEEITVKKHNGGGIPVKVKPEVHVFQKGPQVTTIMANIPDYDMTDPYKSPESRHNFPTLRNNKAPDPPKPSNIPSVAGHHHHHHYSNQNKTPEKTPTDARSTKSLDCMSETSSQGHYKKNEATKKRPTPPKKPLRLSLHRATSLQSVESPLDTQRKPIKRTHKGDPPVKTWPSAEQNIDSTRSPSRADSCQSAGPTIRWSALSAFRSNKSSASLNGSLHSEKWC